MASPRRIYWDACAWIALIQKEKIMRDGVIIEDRDMMCRSVIESAKRGAIEILTSALSLAEVCKDVTLRQQGADAIRDYFEVDYILLVNVDRVVGERARDLMMAGHAGLKPPDAIHLAAAATSGVEEMHTFDGKLRNLNGIIQKSDGTTLKICYPDPGGSPMPLLDNIQGSTHDDEVET